MSAAVSDGYLRPVPGFELPGRYAMFSEQGDDVVGKALAEFLPLANRRASELGLKSFHERLSAFQDGAVQSARGSYYDDYFGWADPNDYDALGDVIARD
jgi:hypothetical protein